MMMMMMRVMAAVTLRVVLLLLCCLASLRAFKVYPHHGSFVSSIFQYLGKNGVHSVKAVNNLQDGLDQLCIQVRAADGRAAVSSTQLHRVHACEHYDVAVTCPEDSEIHIVNALYGRLIADRCDYVTLGRSSSQPGGFGTNCNLNITGIVASRCEGQQRCQFPVENDIFTDPCVGNYKYAEVDFQCRQGQRTKLAYACREDTLVMTCQPWEQIVVKGANYGRGADPDRCQPNNSPPVNCGTDVRDNMAARCDGTRQCVVKMSRISFSASSCSSNSDDYLEVSYICQQSIAKDQCTNKRKWNDRTDFGYQGLGYFNVLRWIEILQILHLAQVEELDITEGPPSLDITEGPLLP